MRRRCKGGAFLLGFLCLRVLALQRGCGWREEQPLHSCSWEILVPATWITSVFYQNGSDLLTPLRGQVGDPVWWDQNSELDRNQGLRDPGVALPEPTSVPRDSSTIKKKMGLGKSSPCVLPTHGAPEFTFSQVLKEMANEFLEEGIGCHVLLDGLRFHFISNLS